MKLVVTLDVQGPDPLRDDPEAIAEDIVAEYQEWQRSNPDAPVVQGVDSAEWAD